jgi:hypothetical protein
MKALIGDAFILGGIGAGASGVWLEFGMPYGLMVIGVGLVVTGIGVVRSA